MTTATFLRDLEGFRGHAALYRLSDPVPFGWNSDVSKTTDHVVISGADVPYSGPETYIFPANSDGEVIDWLEMEGSFRGEIDHARAIAEAGWTTE